MSTHPAPLVDADTIKVLDDAVVALAARRGIWLDTDTPVHLLASLIAQANDLLPLAVLAARRRNCDWADIAQLLGTTAADARRRFENAAVAGVRMGPPRS
ncbi:MAG: hypothetical protein ACT4PX_01275 [Actinomycetota bacterium]